MAERMQVVIDDPFDELFNLEEQYHAEGYDLGQQDGSQAGKIEGRLFGMQHGFEKFAEMGRLHGHSIVWGSRLTTDDISKTANGKHRPTKISQRQLDDSCTNSGIDLQKFLTLESKVEREIPDLGSLKGLEQARLSTLAPRTRLRKQNALLYELTDPESLSFENNKADVEEFESRLKKALAEDEIIRQTTGEDAANEALGNARLETDVQRRSRLVAKSKSRSTDIEDVDVSRLVGPRT